MTSKTFFAEIESTTADARQRLERTPAIQRCLNGQVEMQTYQAFLTEAYHHVKHTVPLLMACGGRLPERLEWLRSAVGEYIEEEMGHQEWILSDIEACGEDKEAVRRSMPLPATELMVSYAYDTIHRSNPVGFFGMVFVLEGTSIRLALDAAEAIQDSLGLPDKAFTYLKSHGALDVGHMGFFEELVNRLDRDEDRQAVVHAARMFFRLYGDIFRSLPLDD